MAYVTGSAILTHRGQGSPSAADIAWADVCAAAIEGALAKRLEDVTPGADLAAELAAAALTDGAALYETRRAPHGVLSMGPDGEAVRLGADDLRACLPVLRRHVIVGIG